MQVFIDANIYLDYFRNRSEDKLTPIRELIKLIENKKVQLLLPVQTKQEFYRNRNTVAEETRKILVKQKEIKLFVPQMMEKTIREVIKVNKITKEIKEVTDALLKKFDKQIEKNKTDADILIEKLFSVAIPLPESEEIYRRAELRQLKGNPPKKRKSGEDHCFGDAIIWETLLKKISDSLSIISRDADFAEKIKGENRLSHFLLSEWKSITRKRLSLYSSLGNFINVISKKQVIKKEIVEAEKNTPIGQSFITQLPIAGITGSLLGDTGISGLNISNTLSGVPINSLYGIKNCPYCGSTQLSSLNVAGNFFLCENCHKSFSINGSSLYFD